MAETGACRCTGIEDDFACAILGANDILRRSRNISDGIVWNRASDFFLGEVRLAKRDDDFIFVSLLLLLFLYIAFNSLLVRRCRSSLEDRCTLVLQSTLLVVTDRWFILEDKEMG